MTKRTARVITDEDKARWHEQYEQLLENSLSEPEAKALALELFKEGRGIQVSRKYRMIATLPKGESALQALARTNKSAHKRIMASAERQAQQEYATYCATKEGNMHEVDLRTFAEFKKLEANGMAWAPIAADLETREIALFGLDDPARELRLRNALLELDKQRKDAK